MRRLFYFLFLYLLVPENSFPQLITIKEARTLGSGENITVTGIVTSGPELGAIRFFQDSTAGLAAYSYSMGSVKSGDSILISGTLRNYASLLELDPVLSFTVLSQNNTLPDPAEIKPEEISEKYEGMLIIIKHAHFETSSERFEGNKNYSLSSNGQIFEIRINSSTNIPGETIPNGPVSLIGILGQYSWDDPNAGFQLLPRNKDDIISESSINIIERLIATQITTSSFELNWLTDTEGTTEIIYGKTPELELGKLSISGTNLNHSISVTNGNPSEIYYVKAFSTNGIDTAMTPIQAFITSSLSSGDVKIYFNSSVDHTVSSGKDAIQLDQTIDDTLIAYINRAKYSIDIAIYNLNNDGISNISTALNNAYDKGLKIRVVYDRNTNNYGINELHSNIGKIAGPESDYPVYGIMHNKFIIIDANSSNPNDPLIWTGSTNLTKNQINTDANNVIIVQDQSLAITYQMEFEEMFGSDGLSPDPEKSKFGPDKKDQTPHFFNIGGHKLECYFSPSDKANARILETINNANSRLNISTMLITRTDIGNLIVEKTSGGTISKIVVNSQNQSGMEEVVNILTDALNGDFKESVETGILHHKYMITDHPGTESDPVVLTGSHNWSSAADLRNDENTIIIHDDTIANIYYQEFVERFAGGKVVVISPECARDSSECIMDTNLTYDVTANDKIFGDYLLSISREPENGTATTPDNKNISYTPNEAFTGLDTIIYKVCMLNDTTLFDTSIFIINTQAASDIKTIEKHSWKIYPNPAGSMLYLNFQIIQASEIIVNILDLTGRVYLSFPFNAPGGEQTQEFNISVLPPGIYILSLKTDKYQGYRKFAIQR
ncbi:MAG: hypothetical protein DRI73_00695 [Bacteroidetes bacterium]|nr:MAG: hypothetical protein DRI73_00695 [Bacteroidota bacterium]